MLVTTIIPFSAIVKVQRKFSCDASEARQFLVRTLSDDKEFVFSSGIVHQMGDPIF